MQEYFRKEAGPLQPQGRLLRAQHISGSRDAVWVHAGTGSWRGKEDGIFIAIGIENHACPAASLARSELAGTAAHFRGHPSLCGRDSYGGWRWENGLIGFTGEDGGHASSEPELCSAVDRVQTSYELWQYGTE